MKAPRPSKRLQRNLERIMEAQGEPGPFIDQNGRACGFMHGRFVPIAEQETRKAPVLDGFDQLPMSRKRRMWDIDNQAFPDPEPYD